MKPGRAEARRGCAHLPDDGHIEAARSEGMRHVHSVAHQERWQEVRDAKRQLFVAAFAAEEIATAFVAGINCYVDLANTGAANLPPEFAIFGTRPARWSPEDVVRIRSHSLMRNALSEVVRANVMSRSSAKIDLLRQALVPPKEPHVADGIELDEIPLEVTDVFRLALAPVTFDVRRLGASLREAHLWRKVAGTGEVSEDPAGQGSNAWAIHGSRTETGRAILASDPHRTHAVSIDESVDELRQCPNGPCVARMDDGTAPPPPIRGRCRGAQLSQGHRVQSRRPAAAARSRTLPCRAAYPAVECRLSDTPKSEVLAVRDDDEGRRSYQFVWPQPANNTLGQLGHRIENNNPRTCSDR